MINDRNVSGYCRPGDTVFIYPSSDKRRGLRHSTAARVCDPAYDEITGCLRVRIQSEDPNRRKMILVAPTDVCRDNLRERTSPMSGTYPMSL